jgi:hypothetical protein
MDWIPWHRRETAALAVARFAIRNRLALAVLLVLTTLVFLYPVANTLLEAAGHRLPGPTVHFHSTAWPHHTDPHRVHPESLRAGRTA